MRDSIIVAVVDTGVDYDKLKASVRENLYRNHGEIAGNGRDDDRNGFVDDVTGPSTGPASNHYYQPKTSSHGGGMVTNVSNQIDAGGAIAGRDLPISIMPVSMNDGQYYANILKAAQAGASVISLSHNVTYEQKSYISRMLEPFDAIAVTVDRDGPRSTNPDAGEDGRTTFDNVLEVALISSAIVKGNVNVDLLEVGSSIKNTSESHAISNVAGKVGAIWAVDPSRSAAEIVDICAASTTREHAIVKKNGLHSQMGGQIDLERGIAIAMGKGKAAEKATAPTEAPDHDEPARSDPAPVKGDRHHDDGNFIEAAGYTRGTKKDDVFVIESKRATLIGNGGDDVFVFNEFARREHIVRDFDDGDVLDVSALVGSSSAGRIADHVRLVEASWGGSTHTRVLVEHDGAFEQAVILIDVDDLSLRDMVAGDALIL